MDETSWANLSWLQLLQKARLHSGYFGVIDRTSLVSNAIKAPMWLVYGTDCPNKRRKNKNIKPTPLSAKGVPLPRRRYFDDIGQACLHLSPTQYLWSFACGNIRQEIDNLIDWEQDTLLTSFGKSFGTILNLPKRWAIPFQTNTDPLGQSVCNMYFAQTGFVAVRGQKGLCYQCYENGWMVTPPTMIEDVLPEIGCAIGGSLTEEWFPDLPFTLDKALSAIPEELSAFIRVIWHDTDDILPLRFVNASPLDLIQAVTNTQFF